VRTGVDDQQFGFPLSDGSAALSMASGYNLVGRPPLIGVHEGEDRVLLRREGLADLLGREPGASPAAA
jgi:hypothetical protein